MTKLQELREYIRKIIIKEISSSGAAGGYSTPFCFGKRKKNPGAILGYTSVKQLREARESIFEDVINNVSFDIKFSDQAKELMDYIHSNEKYEDDLENIQKLFDKMSEDGTFSKEEAFKVYKEFIEMAARDFVKETGQNISADEYFLRKDVLGVIYYYLSKIENPMNSGASDNIDTPADGQQPQPQQAQAQGGEQQGADSGGGSTLGGASPFPETPEGEAPPEGEVPPEGEAPPEGENAEEAPGKGPKTKPEDIKEIKNMVNEIFKEMR